MSQKEAEGEKRERTRDVNVTGRDAGVLDDVAEKKRGSRDGVTDDITGEEWCQSIIKRNRWRKTGFCTDVKGTGERRVTVVTSLGKKGGGWARETDGCHSDSCFHYDITSLNHSLLFSHWLSAAVRLVSWLWVSMEYVMRGRGQVKKKKNSSSPSSKDGVNDNNHHWCRVPDVGLLPVLFFFTIELWCWDWSMLLCFRM